jgi:acyl CoA:acetate/3-ketoacid CoA transferase
MSLGTSSISVLRVTPVVGAPNSADLTFDAENVTTYATQALATTAGSMATTVAGAATMTAAEITQTSTTGAISMSAFTDIVLSAGGNPTVTIKNDRILIKGDMTSGDQRRPFRACRRCR